MKSGLFFRVPSDLRLVNTICLRRYDFVISVTESVSYDTVRIPIPLNIFFIFLLEKTMTPFNPINGVYNTTPNSG